MKKVLLLAFLSSALIIGLSQEAFGQRTSKRSSSTDEYFDESGGFKHRLWYGSHLTLGFQGNSFQSTFQAGLAPMIGYKLIESLSVGPRGSVTYFSYRLNQGGGDVQKLNTTSWSVGAFARFRPVETFFGQVEANLVNEPNNIIWNNVTQELDVTRRERSAINIGLGYTSSSGGPIAFEALILYNINPPSNDITSPLDYRFGLTYNF